MTTNYDVRRISAAKRVREIIPDLCGDATDDELIASYNSFLKEPKYQFVLVTFRTLAWERHMENPKHRLSPDVPRCLRLTFRSYWRVLKKIPKIPLPA